MSLTVEHNFVAGVPQTALAGFAPHAICWHWTAGNPGRVGALQTINHFVATRGTVNASYHILVWPEHGPDHVGCKTFAMWIVPASRAAHSIAPSQIYQPNPNKDQALQGVRIAEVTRILARDWDPNADVIAVSYCGAPGNLEHDKMCPTFVEDCRKINRDLAAIPSVDPRPLFGHGWIQPISRYEMDVSLDFIALLYQETATAPPPPPTPAPIQEEDVAIREATKGVELIDGGATARIRAGATARWLPRFNPQNYDDYLVGTRGIESVSPAYGWVQGTNITLNNGQVLYPSTRWLLSGSAQSGVFFWHEADVIEVIVPKTGITQAEVDAAAEAARDLAIDQAAAAVLSIK